MRLALTICAIAVVIVCGVGVGRPSADGPTPAPALIRVTFEDTAGAAPSLDGTWLPSESVADGKCDVVTGEAAPEGKAFGRLSCRAREGGQVRFSIPTTLRPGAELALSVWLRATKLPGSARAALEVLAADASGRRDEAFMVARVPAPADGTWSHGAVDLSPICLAGPTYYVASVDLVFSGLGKGDEAALDIDDLELAGDYGQGLGVAVAQAQAGRLSVGQSIASMRQQLANLPSVVRVPSGLPSALREALTAAKEWYGARRTDVAASLAPKSKGLPRTDRDVLRLSTDLAELGTVTAQFDQARRRQSDEGPAGPLALWTLPVSGLRLPAPNAQAVCGVLASSLSLTLSPGETRYTAIAVRPDQDVSGLEVHCPSLRRGGDGPALEAPEWQVWHVLSWWQATEPLVGAGTVALTPELLTHNPSLVAPSADGPDNRISPTGVPDDADQTQACALADGSVHTFVLALTVPETTPSGTYLGQLDLRFDGGSVSLPVRVTVQPFHLVESPFDLVVELRARLGDRTAPDLSTLDEGLMRKTLEHIRSMGATAVTIDEPLEGAAAGTGLRRALELRKAVGFAGGPTILHEAEGWFREAAVRPGGATEDLKQAASDAGRAAASAAAEIGTQAVAVSTYPWASVGWIPAEAPMAEAFRAAGLEVFAAADVDSARGLDWARYLSIPARGPADSKALATRDAPAWLWPSVAGLERPGAARHSLGLAAIAAGFRGVYLPYWEAFGNPWDDLDTMAKDRMTAYPTAHGIIQTVQSVAVAEAVTDLRYLATLDDLVSRARKLAGLRPGDKGPDSLRRATDERARALASADPDDARAHLVGAIGAARSFLAGRGE